MFQFKTSSLQVKKAAIEFKMQCGILFFLILYVSIDFISTTTPYLKEIGGNDYCERLTEIKNDTKCGWIDLESYYQTIDTEEYKIIFYRHWIALQIQCRRSEADNITLIPLTVNNVKLKKLTVYCPKLNWHSNDFMRLLNINEVDKFQHRFNSCQYDMKMIEESAIISHIPRNLSLWIDSIPSIPRKNLTLFSHYSNITSLRLYTAIDKMYSDFFTTLFPILEEITWYLRACLPTNELLSGLNWLSVINIVIFDDAVINKNLFGYDEVQYYNDNYDFYKDDNRISTNISIPEFKSCNELHFMNMRQLRKVSLNDQRSENQKLNKTFSFPKFFLRGAKYLEMFEVIGFHLFSIPRKMFQDQQRLSRLILKDITWVPTSREDRYTHYVAFLWYATLKNNLEYLTITPKHTPFLFPINILPTYSKLKIFESDGFIISDQLRLPMKTFICGGTSICTFSRDINNKSCPIPCNCVLNRDIMEFIIECNGAQYGQIPELPIPITGSPTLHFEGNQLVELPSVDSLYGYANLQELHLANNNLKQLSIAQLPPNITYLDISNNNLETLDEEVMSFLSQRDQLGLKLSGNPWRCDCNAKPLLEFVKNMGSRIDDLDSVTCNKTLELLRNLEEADICPSLLPLFSILLGVLLVVATITIIFQINKQRIQISLYEHNMCLWWVTREELDKDKIFDAFLAFSHKDMEKVPEFIERLENGPRKFNLCFYDRDWLIGVPIPESICKSIEDSKRTIILFTKSFLESSWGRFEFRLAIKATSQDKCKRLIVILFPDVENIDDLDTELKNYMIMNTYLKRNDANFWNKLIYAMPHNSRTFKGRGINQPRNAETRPHF